MTEGLTHEWKTSSRSADSDCVEVRLSPGAANVVEIRDSKNPAMGPLRIDLNAWLGFLGSVDGPMGD